MTTPRIVPPTGANIGAARLDSLHSELEAHMASAEQHYRAALEQRAAAKAAHAAGASSQQLYSLALLNMNLTVIEQNAASLCQQQIQIILQSSVLACVTGGVEDGEEPDLPDRSTGVKPA